MIVNIFEHHPHERPRFDSYLPVLMWPRLVCQGHWGMNYQVGDLSFSLPLSAFQIKINNNFSRELNYNVFMVQEF